MTTTVAPPPAKLLTVAEYAALPNSQDGSKDELVRGQVIRFPRLGFQGGIVVLNISVLITGYLKAHRSGTLAIGTGVVTERNPDTVRGPNLSFWSFERLPRNTVVEIHPDIVPDLCVEVTSPWDSRPKLMAKVHEYLGSGVRMVWLVDPDERTVTVYRKPGDGRILWEDATLDGEDVLPGFTCPVADFFIGLPPGDAP